MSCNLLRTSYRYQDPSDPLYFEPVGGWRWDDGSSLNYYERQQANSSFLKGESAPGKLFRLGHGINNIKTNHRRVFVTFFAVDEGITNVTLSDLGEGWEHIIGDGSDYEIDGAGNYKFEFSQHNTHAFALDNVLFITGYSYLTRRSKKVLDNIAETIKKETFSFVIQGHVCCTDGTVDAVDKKTNQRNLSVARAKYVYDFFIEKGINRTRMSYEGLAHRFPLGGSEDKDRRVETVSYTHLTLPTNREV